MLIFLVLLPIETFFAEGSKFCFKGLRTSYEVPRCLLDVYILLNIFYPDVGRL